MCDLKRFSLHKCWFPFIRESKQEFKKGEKKKYTKHRHIFAVHKTLLELNSRTVLQHSPKN